MATRREALGAALAATGAGALAPLLRAAQPEHDSPADISAAYDLDPTVIYLNHASIGTTPRAVRRARARYLEEIERNPWLYVWGDIWVEAVERARATLAAYLGCAAEELAITRSTTEAMNILAQGMPLEPGDEVLHSSLNHIGASRCFEHWGERRGYRVRRFEFPIAEAPDLTPDDVLRLHLEQIGERTRLLVIPHVDNMIGLRHPVSEIAGSARRAGVEWIVVDGAQTVGMIPVDVRELGVDAYATSAHKWLQSPKGEGLLYLRGGLVDGVKPMTVTWGQDRWAGSARKLEDYGTRDPGDLLALADAAAFQARLGDAWPRRRALVRRLREGVEAASGLRWRSPTHPALGSAIAAVEAPGTSSGAIFDRLHREHGMVFRAFGGELNTVRISVNLANTEAQIARFLEVV